MSINDPVRYLGIGPYAGWVGRISRIEHELKDNLFKQYTIAFQNGASVRASDCDVILSVPYEFQFTEVT